MTGQMAATTFGCYYQFSDGLRVEPPTTVTLRGGVKLQAVSLPSAPLPTSTKKAKPLDGLTWLKSKKEKRRAAEHEGPALRLQ